MAIVRLDKLQAVKAGNIVSFRNDTGNDFDNGLVFELGDLVGTARELYDIVIPTNVDTQEILIHATPEVMYQVENNGLADFSLADGATGRGYHMSVGDIITVTEDIITDTEPLIVGNFLVADAASYQLECLDADPGVAVNKFCAVIIEETTLGFDQEDAVAFRVIRV